MTILGAEFMTIVGAKLVATWKVTEHGFLSEGGEEIENC